MRMTKPAAQPRRPSSDPHPQPLALPGEQRPETCRERDELDAAREWLRHVEAGRIG